MMGDTVTLLSETRGYWGSQLRRRSGQVRDLAGDEITETDFGFTGQRNYVGFGLMDYSARFYSPTLGRFIQPDTVIPALTNSQAWNRYTYSYNNPLNYTDPSGHFPEQPPNSGPCLDGICGPPNGPSNPSPSTPSGGGDQPGDIDDDVSEVPGVPKIDGGYTEGDANKAFTVWQPSQCYAYTVDGGWVIYPCAAGKYWDRDNNTLTKYQGSWEPWVGLAVDGIGVLVDVAGYYITFETAGVGTPFVVALGEAWGTVEASWYGYNMAQGNYDGVYQFTQQEIFDAGSPIPYIGIVNSTAGFFDNIRVIKNSSITFDVWHAHVSNPADLPGNFPVLGYSEYYYGREESPWYRPDWRSCPAP
jgi:RHS repeat-associated protein